MDKLIEIANIWPAITINLKCENAHETPCKPYRSNVAYIYVPIAFDLRQYGAYLSTQCVPNTRISDTF